MKNKSIIYYINLGLILFFLLNILVSISKADDHIYSKIDYTHNPNRSFIELVITSENSNFRLWNRNNTEATINYSSTVFKESLFNSFARLYYEQSIIQKLKSLSTRTTFSKNLISVLQKKNNWHQTAQEEPHLN